MQYLLHLHLPQRRLPPRQRQILFQFYFNEALFEKPERITGVDESGAGVDVAGNGADVAEDFGLLGKAYGDGAEEEVDLEVEVLGDVLVEGDGGPYGQWGCSVG